MKSTNNHDVERAELAVEANLAKFRTAVDHLEDKIIESRAMVEEKVDKVKSIVNKPKNIMHQVSDKAHSLTDKVTGRAHDLTDRAATVTTTYANRGADLGLRFWERAEARPIPYIIGAAALFGGMIYWLVSHSEVEEEENLWGW